MILPAFAQTYNFTNASATGKNGPSQAQVNAAYSATNLNGQVTATNGIQQWTVPATGNYRITAAGANGGNTAFSSGGTGIIASCEVSLTAGTVLNIVVGQQGTYNNNGSTYVSSGSGGGGSFVYTGAIGGGGLIAAAGGGGGGLSSTSSVVAGNVSNANFGPNGATITDAGGYISLGGTGGNGGGFSNRSMLSGGPGAGWLSDYNATYAVNNPGLGGTRFVGGTINGLGTEGGFGGGGASGETSSGYFLSYCWSGGGGGYSGGGSGHNGGAGDGQVGGGGGSFLTGSNQSNLGFNNGMGYVTILNLYSATITLSQGILCNGDANGSLTAAPSGGTGPYTYSWAPVGGTSPTATGLAAGSYTCTITDASLNVATATFLLTEPAPLVATTMQNNVSCNGGTNGDAMVMVTGGTPSYTYSWSSGGNASTESNLAAGTYTCTTTDANGCTTMNTVTVTEPPAMVNNPIQIDVTCNGLNDGSATVAPAGGTGSYTYNWSPSGGSAATESNLIAGVYTCTITDSNGCTSTEVFTITEPSALDVTSTITNPLCFGDSNGAATVSVSGGTPGYTYSWTSGGTGATDSGLVAGSYTCTVTDANGCTTAHSVTVTEPAQLTSTSNDTNVTCFGGNDGAIMVTPAGGTAPYTYMWIPNVGSGPYVNNLTAGSYSYVVTDANGCTLPVAVTLTEPPAIAGTISATNATTCGGSDGALDLTASGGTGSFTYMWSDSSTTEDITGLTAGSYTVTVTDSIGCAMSFTGTVADPAGPTVSVAITTSTMCFDDGSLTLSGGSPAGGTWSGPGVATGTFDPSVAGNGMQVITYSYTDANNCIGTAADSINVDPCAGVIENNSGSLMLYPNPTSGVFSITTEPGATIMIYNSLGSVVANTVAANSKSEIDMTGFAEGIYLVVVEQNNARSTAQVILSK